MISLTGSEGFIGSHINFANERIDLRVKGKDVCNISYYMGDVVIHLAAESSVQGSMRDMVSTARNNLYGLAKVIDACKKNNKRLIFASSSSVVDPQSPYAYSKLWGEQLIEMSGLQDYAILRLGNVYGDGDNKSAIHLFDKAKKITIYGDGEQLRNFIHVEDVVQALDYYANTRYKGTFNIGNENLTVNEVAALFGKPIEYAPARKGDNLNSSMRSDWKCNGIHTLMRYVEGLKI